MEMIDMGKEVETGEQPTEVKGSKKVSYSGFSMVGDQIPEELGNMKNGEKCHLHIVVRKVGDTLDTYSKGEPRRVEVEIHKLGAIEGMTAEEYGNLSDEEKDKKDKESVEEKVGEEE